MTAVLFVVAAGAGALGRFGLGRVVCSWQALLIANTVGSGLFGLVITSDLDPRWLTVLGTGFCGALTTYSSFAWELRREGWRFAVWYAPLTIACASGAASLGATF
jgi:CrcB protein